MSKTGKESCCGATTACCEGGTDAPPAEPKAASGCCGGAQTDQDVVEGVKEYYGQTLKTSESLKTSACTACERPHDKIARIIEKIPKEVNSKFYGCGFPTPLGIEGMRVLDLGCGSGRDCYIASALVGEQGRVIGVDMTKEQLAVARAHAKEYCTGELGYSDSNMSFLEGYIESLSEIGIEEGSVDLIISNCVVNLSVNKEAVLKQLHRALAFGGEFQFSDVFSDQVLPQAVRTHKVLVGECLGGAMEESEFLALAQETGFLRPQMVTKKEIEVHDPELRSLLGSARFYSITYRLFKIPEKMRFSCCDKRVVAYNGSFQGSPSEYKLNSSLTFGAHVNQEVKGDVASILHNTWVSKFFEVPCCAPGAKSCC